MTSTLLNRRKPITDWRGTLRRALPVAVMVLSAIVGIALVALA